MEEPSKESPVVASPVVPLVRIFPARSPARASFTPRTSAELFRNRSAPAKPAVLGPPLSSVDNPAPANRKDVIPVPYAIAAMVLLAALALCILQGRRAAQRRLLAKLENSFGQIPDNSDCALDSVSSYHDQLAQHCAPERLVDSLTWDDLEMDRVFCRINACQSSVGEEVLFHQLHAPCFDVSTLARREELLQALEAQPQRRVALQALLAQLGKLNYSGLPSLLFEPEQRILPHAWVYRVLAWLPALGLPLLFLKPVLGLAWIVTCAVVNAFLYAYMKIRLESRLGTVRYFSALLWCCERLLKLGFPGSPELAQAYRPFRRLRGRASSLTQQRLSDLEVVADLVKMLFLADLVKYNRIMATVRRHLDSLRRLYRLVGELDAAISTLSFRHSLTCQCQPTFIADNQIAFTAVYHPLLEHPVPNTGVFRQNGIITGSNASGKSTFIKALAVNCLLAQTLHTCCARSYALRPCLVITSMALRDNIVRGESYFVAEIKSLKRILDRVPQVHCACFIDEILRGTNTAERIAASCAVLRYLYEQDCLCVVASHDIELTELLRDRYANYHFQEEVTDGGISFDFKLKDGPSHTRNAIKLLSLMGFDPAITAEAERLAGAGE